MNKELEEYKEESRNFNYLVIGYFFSIFGIFSGIVAWDWLMYVLGVCLLGAIINHHRWYRKRFSSQKHSETKK